MGKSKTYILLRDLPDGSKAGDEYKKLQNSDRYTNQRFVNDRRPVIEDVFWFTWQVENNPEWFVEKEEKPTIEDIRIESGYAVFDITSQDLGHKISLKRLAEILIAEKEGRLMTSLK